MRAGRRSQIQRVSRSGVRGGLGSEAGSSVLEVALLLPVLVALLIGAVDFGKGYYLAIEVAAAAEAGALYGSQNWSDTSGMQSAALLDASDTPGVQATASYGCECSDGSSAIAICTTSPTCAVNVVNYVQVNTTANYTPIFPYPGIPSVFALKGASRLRSGH